MYRNAQDELKSKVMYIMLQLQLLLASIFPKHDYCIVLNVDCIVYRYLYSASRCLTA